MSTILASLDTILAQRKQKADTQNSYVAQLHHKGLNKILEKVGEEATETIIAAKDFSNNLSNDKNKQEIISETADLWFHSMVMLSHLNLNSDNVLHELAKRFELSGLTEKASRANK